MFADETQGDANDYHNAVSAAQQAYKSWAAVSADLYIYIYNYNYYILYKCGLYSFDVYGCVEA